MLPSYTLATPPKQTTSTKPANPRLVRACVIGGMATDLVADGYGINMRPCARNDPVLLGLASDPAE